MTIFEKLGNDIFAAVDAAGNPRKVVNLEAQVWTTTVESVIDAALATGGLIYDSKADIDADLAHAANTMAWVLGDATTANNGIYQKSGASGAGSWAKVGELPYSLIKATDAGAGTANAIVATTATPVPSAAYSTLVVMNVFEANTGAVTVALNGGSAKSLVTNGGSALASGYLTAGMVVAFVDDGTNYRLVSDVASAAIQAASEAAQAAAETARDEAVAAAATVSAPKLTIALAEADDPASDPEYYDIAFRDSNYVADSGARWRKVLADPGHGMAFQNANLTWYELHGSEHSTAVFGATGDGSTDDTAAMALIAAYYADIGGGTLRLASDANFLIDQWDLSLVSGLKIVGGHSASFTERTGTLGDATATGRAQFIQFGAGSGIDHLEYSLPTGLTRRRVSDLSATGSYIKSWNLAAIDQQNNRVDRAALKVIYDGEVAPFTVGATLTGPSGSGTIIEVVDDGTTGSVFLYPYTGIFADNDAITDSATGSATVNGTPAVDSATGGGENEDAAIIASGALVRLGSGKVVKFDHPYRVSSTDHTIGDLISTDYVNGGWVYQCTRGRIGLISASTASIHSGVLPGHNACLITDPVNTIISKIIGYDAGEHGVRFGGSTGANGVDIDYMRVHNSGGDGWKVRSAGVATPNKNINVKVAIVSDSGTGSVAGDWGPNEEGIHIERAQNIVVGWARVFKSSKTKSCARGIRINSSTGITINGGLIEDCDDQAIYLENTDDDGVTSRNLTDITIKATVVNPASHAFYMVYSAIGAGSMALRNINIDITGRTIAGDGFHIANTGGTVTQACVFKGNFQTLTGSVIAGTALTTNNSLLSFHYFLDGVETRFVPSNSTSGTLYDFRSNVGSSNARVCLIQTDGDISNTNNSYTALSTAFIKAMIEDAGSQWDDVRSMRVRKYVNRMNGMPQIGLVAEELRETSPGLVKEGSNEELIDLLRAIEPGKTDDELREMTGGAALLMVKYSIVNVKLLKAFQEAQLRIEEAEARLAALEATIH